MTKVSKRHLAVRFVDLLDTEPLTDLASGLVAAAFEAGYTQRDIPALVAAVEHELRLRKSAVEVQITTARATSDEQLQQIAAEVAAQAGAQHFSIADRVNPELLGGFEAEADGVTVRNSIRSQLLTSGAFNG